MAGVRLVSISTPASSTGVGHVFCASGSADAKVTKVTVELFITSNPTAVFSTMAAVVSEQWKTPVTLPSFDTEARYELNAFGAETGDGSNVIQLQYDPSI